MRVRDVMSSPVVSVTPEGTVKEAAELLVERGFNALPVVAGDDVGGIVTEAHLVPLESSPNPRSHILPLPADSARIPHTVAEVMTPEVITLPPQQDAAGAAPVVVSRRRRGVPR